MFFLLLVPAPESGLSGFAVQDTKQTTVKYDGVPLPILRNPDPTPESDHIFQLLISADFLSGLLPTLLIVPLFPKSLPFSDNH